jgi:hypothetical protein
MFSQHFAALLTVLCTTSALCSCSTATTEADTSRFSDVGAHSARRSVFPSDKVVGWGDSLTYSLTSIGGVWQQADPTWLDTIGADLHVDTANFGIPSQGSAEIAVQQGGLKPLVTLVGNQIPSGSTTAITVTAINPTDGWTQYPEAGTMTMHGALAGVSGTLQHTVTSGVHSYSFVPDAATVSVVPVPAGSAFSGDQGADYRDGIQIIWAGTNNSAQTAAIERDIASMVHWMTASPSRYLIIDGTIPAIENDLSSTYGSQFVDLRSWLISDGLAAAGITPTPDDTEAIATGNIPPSLIASQGHFTQAAYTAIGHHLAAVMKDKGWI